MSVYREIEAAVLAGGRGSRLGGVEKASLAHGEARLVDYVVGQLRARVARVFLVARPEQRLAGHEVVHDTRPGEGPLAAIEAALAATRAPWCLVVSVDLPLLTRELLDVLVAARAPNARCVAPLCSGGIEPLCSLWRSSLAPEVSSLVDRGERSARAALLALGAQLVELPPRLEEQLRSLNLPSDLRTLKPQR